MINPSSEITPLLCSSCCGMQLTRRACLCEQTAGGSTAFSQVAAPLIPDSLPRCRTTGMLGTLQGVTPGRITLGGVYALLVQRPHLGSVSLSAVNEAKTSRSYRPILILEIILSAAFAM